MKIKPLLTSLLLVLSLSLQAQQDTIPDQLWSLQECIEYALKYNLNVKRSEFDVEESKVILRQARLSRLPTANAQTGYGYSWGRGLDPVTNQFVTQEITSASIGANASLPIFNGLNIHNTIRQSSHDYMASEYDLQKTKNDVIINVSSLFINVVFNKELVENARLQLASSEEQLMRTKAQVEVGSLPRSDQYNMEAQVASNELSLVQNENALAFSLLQLKQALQIPATQPFDVEIPDLEPEDLVMEQSPEEIFQIAKGTMPEMKSADLRVESSYYAVKAARGLLYPRLSLNGSIQTNYSSTTDEFVANGNMIPRVIGVVRDVVPAQEVVTFVPDGTYRDYSVADQFQDNIYRVLNLQLTIPIFNSYQSRATFQRSKINRQRAEINLQETSNILRQNVETAYNDVVAASKTYNSTLKQVNAREEAYRMVKQRFEVGAANYVEYQVSENDLFQARSDLARAKYEFIFRKKILDFYQGKPLEY